MLKALTLEALDTFSDNRTVLVFSARRKSFPDHTDAAHIIKYGRTLQYILVASTSSPFFPFGIATASTVSNFKVHCVQFIVGEVLLSLFILFWCVGNVAFEQG